MFRLVTMANGFITGGGVCVKKNSPHPQTPLTVCMFITVAFRWNARGFCTIFLRHREQFGDIEGRSDVV